MKIRENRCFFLCTRPWFLACILPVYSLSEGHQVIILDAAVLLEAGWDEMCQEVWVTFVPSEEVDFCFLFRDCIYLRVHC